MLPPPGDALGYCVSKSKLERPLSGEGLIFWARSGDDGCLGSDLGGLIQASVRLPKVFPYHVE